jgi:multiple sugar transport system substrate-binding protein
MGSFLGIMASYGGGIADDRGCAQTHLPGTLAAWQLFTGLKNADRATPPDIAGWDYPELLVGLQNGTLAMASFFTAGMPILTDCAQSPQVCSHIALSVQPAGPAGSRTRVNPLGLMVNAASARLPATFEFVKWATGPEGARVYTQAGGASPRLSLLADGPLNTQRPWTPEVLKAVRAGIGTIRHAQAREIGEAFDRFAQLAVAGSITPEESLRRATAEIRSQVQARCG